MAALGEAQPKGSTTPFNLSPFEINVILLVLYSKAFMDAYIMSQIGLIYEPLAQEHYHIYTYQIGIIFAIFPACAGIVAYFTPTILKFISKKNALILSFFFQVLATYGLGWIHNVPDPGEFFSISILLNIWLGFGAGLAHSILLSAITVSFPTDELPTKIGAIEIAHSFGGLFGPIIGAMLESVGGYAWSFIFAGSLMTALNLVVIVMFPSFENKTAETIDERLANIDIDNTPAPALDLKYFMPLACMFAMFSLVYTEMITQLPKMFGAHLLIENLRAKPLELGLIICSRQLVVILFTTCIANKMAKSEEKWKYIVFGLLLQAVDFMLYVPSSIFPQSSFVVATASHSLNGLVKIFVIIPVIPIILEEANKNFDDPLEHRANTASSMFVCAFNLGMFAGDLIGGLLVGKLGYEKSFDLAALISWFAALIFATLFLSQTSLKASKFKRYWSSNKDMIQEPTTGKPKGALEKIEEVSEEDEESLLLRNSSRL